MIVKYDHDCKFVHYECSNCGYKYKEYYNSFTPYTETDKTTYGDEPFIKGESDFIYQEEAYYAPNRLVKKTIYACPHCGVLQIDVS